MGGASVVTVLVFVFGPIYLAYQEPAAGFVAIGCGIFSMLNVALFVLVHRNLDVVFTVQAILAFLTGLIHVFVFGSFANSSGAFLYCSVFVLMGTT
jgi:hypothetical protein